MRNRILPPDHMNYRYVDENSFDFSCLPDGWKIWLRSNKNKLQDSYGNENRFVITILSQIKNLNPEDVETQYHFKDSKNGNRRADFLILNTIKGYCLAIELDGTNRPDRWTQKGWTDYLERQNSEMNLWELLRFSNSKMYADPGDIAKEISKLLLRQNSKHIETSGKDLDHEEALRIARRKEEEAIEAKEDRILIAKASNIKTKEHGAELIKINKALESLSSKASYSQNNDTLKKVGWSSYFSGALLLAVMAYSVFYASGATDKPHESTVSISPSPDKDRKPINQEPDLKKKELKSKLLTIDRDQVPFSVGKTVKVCETLTEKRRFEKGVNLNFGGNHPNQTYSVTLWDNQMDRVGSNIKNVDLGSVICATGKLEQFKNEIQMRISSANHLTLELNNNENNL